jgi:hypothetical protein
VTYADLQAVLNFMYHGEVSVAQDSLNSFLAVAEELHVKGLTQKNSNSSSANGAGSSGAEWGDGEKNTTRTASGGGGHRNSSSGNNSVVGTSSVTAIASKKHDLPHRVNNSSALSGGSSMTRSAPRDLEEPSAKRSKPGGGLPLTSSTMALPYSLQKHKGKEEEEEEDDIQEVLPVKQEPVSGGHDMGLPPPSSQHRNFDAKVNCS